MGGDQFLDALRATIAPATITLMKGRDKGIDVTLSDGRTFTIKRQRVRDLEQADAYIAELLR